MTQLQTLGDALFDAILVWVRFHHRSTFLPPAIAVHCPGV
jgi:hypothetical protein